jgi:O-antigen/teichoic acid export membrane protein
MLAGSSVIGQAANAALLALLAHGLTVRQLGSFLSVLGMLLVAADLVDFGLSSRALRDVAAGTAPPQLFATVMGQKVFASALLTLCVAALAPLVPMTALLLCFAPWVFTRGLLQPSLHALQAEGRYASMSIVNIADRGVTAVAVMTVLLLRGNLRLWQVALCYDIGSAVAVGCAVAQLRVRPSMTRQTFSLLRSYKRGASFGVAGAVTNLVTLDVAVVGTIAGPAVGGIYGLPSRVAGPVASLAGNVAVAALPALARERDPGAALRQLMRSGGRVLMPVLAVLTALFIFSGGVMQMLGGASFAASAVPFRIYIAASCLVVVNQQLVVFLQSRHREALVATVLTIAAPISLAVLAIGAWVAGAAGAACGYLVSNTFVLVALGRAVRRLVATQGVVHDVEPVGPVEV